MSATLTRSINIPLLSGTNLREDIEVPAELKILEGTDEPELGCCAIRILDPQFGDKRITWDSRSLAEIQAAKKMFVELIKKGYKPYKVSADGKKSNEVMTEFDPSAEEVVMVEIIMVPMPLVVGG